MDESDYLISQFKAMDGDLINTIESKLNNPSYISLLMFKNYSLIGSVNNNFNAWADNYTLDDMREDQVFHAISYVAFQHCKRDSCHWNSVVHANEASLKVHKKRQDFDLHHGVTLLESITADLTISINMASSTPEDEDVFYAQTVLHTNGFLNQFKRALSLD